MYALMELGERQGSATTVVHECAKYGSATALRDLLMAGGARLDPDVLDIEDGFPAHTPLYHACMRGVAGLECVKVLLSLKADPNASQLGGTTILLDTIKQGATATARVLLEHGADAKVLCVHSGCTTLHVAVNAGAPPDFIRLLFFYGADPLRPGMNVREGVATPLELARSISSDEAIIAALKEIEGDARVLAALDASARPSQPVRAR
jgi:ankyrin repeat protein